ncbi:nucleolar protein dao-5-like isoform X1 [Mya arenaria]|uniref:nucleolar protein dao-5-like isoform X1 n=1 Tax=Mya arenaria TaxID=6604 RepID=UPI0022E06298|nr:nucleolar protein dao-5-like isoform X1 [Mya arenaria]XP_052799783.1 nucleolar protein dao-5-like isoform X1 [Mya arenaria]XP_052799784.1 nucleolar protein dao-5-like isoform X1 [Mya arenaria]XP_052799785.1 nucleolar protein dao-5-like isoform X1 [Mya arenaria]XP_052799787.1 nucleolar protein dao-5-like isoform X1 [Mya arenaria]XP_052799788.1 nucleolar protein dao-5-like isoform X1 [Mya arenaria]XP_052799789.1 nucleolar protein dao-5-like isoform X1 [Mya arenaria]XP_052799790.1 nucleolar 
MSNLMNFDDEGDSLFKPEEHRPAKSFEDIFGKSEAGVSSLDDVLTPKVDDDIFKPLEAESSSKSSKKEETSQQFIDSLFGNDADDEPDFLFTNEPAEPITDARNESSTDDIFDSWFNTPATVEDKGKHKTPLNDLDDLLRLQPDTRTESNSEDDLLGFGTNVAVANNDTTTKQNNFDPRKREEGSHDLLSADESPDSLDLLLEAQPLGTVPSCDDLLSIIEPDTNTAANSNIPIMHVEKVKKEKVPDPEKEVYKFFDDSDEEEDHQVDSGLAQEQTRSDSPVNTESEPEEDQDTPVLEKEISDTAVEQEADTAEDSGLVPEEVKKELEEENLGEREEEPSEADQQEEVVRGKGKEEPTPARRTNLKKSSMERSFEDLLTGLSDESEPELDDMLVGDMMESSNLESILASPKSSVTDGFSSPLKPSSLDISMDVVSSTPNAGVKAKVTHTPVKVTPPEVRIDTPEEEEEDIEFVDGVENGDEGDVVMRHGSQGRKPLTDEEDFDLPDVQDTNHLDIDVSKHKSALGKQGSMGLRRKMSRKSRKSLLSSGEDAIFQDSTEPKPEPLQNGDADTLDGEARSPDMSPPSKKPSPAMMVPLPGMSGSRPPSQRLSSSAAEGEDKEPKAVKRLSRPPPGAFVLPKPQIPLKSPTKPSTRPPAEDVTTPYEKPALRSVKPLERGGERSSSPEPMETGTFASPALRSTGLLEREKRERSESSERDITYSAPPLRSRPKLEKDEDKEISTGIFAKPALRSTPKPKPGAKPQHRETPEFSKPLRSAAKPDTHPKPETKKHTFETPALKSTGRKITPPMNEINSDDLNNSANSGDHVFEKPALRQIDKPTRSDSIGESMSPPPSHTFEKPVLKPSSTPTVSNTRNEQFTPGTFAKPSLKKTSTSPEKEVKSSSEAKGIFDRPALRKAGSVNKEEREKTPDKPSWLQQAADKQTKALDVIQSKENHPSTEKQVPSWLESSQLKKTRGTPLQDSSNNQSSEITEEDSGKPPSSARRRNQSSSSENEPEKSRSGSVTKTGQDNYSPSWMRQGRSPSVPSTGVMSPPTNLPSANSEVPSWKRELAQRRASRKDKLPEESPMKTEVKAEPEWKKGIVLRKTRQAGAPTKEPQTVEPEWKKAAEEKKARLRSKSLQYTHLSFK